MDAEKKCYILILYAMPFIPMLVDPENVMYDALYLNRGIKETFFSVSILFAFLERLQKENGLMDLAEVLSKWSKGMLRLYPFFFLFDRQGEIAEYGVLLGSESHYVCLIPFNVLLQLFSSLRSKSRHYFREAPLCFKARQLYLHTMTSLLLPMLLWKRFLTLLFKGVPKEVCLIQQINRK